MFVARGHTGMAKTIAISVVLRLRLEAALFMNGPYRFYFFTQGKTFDYEIDSAQTRTGGFQSLPATTWCLAFSQSLHVVAVSGVKIHKYSILYEALAVARASYQGGLLPPPLDFDILSLLIALFRRYLQQAVHPERVLENAFASFGPSA
ncbi:hypothetical protein K443DRAFT_12709 [Laccaria amethystina LaAM-08-1]|uniref:Uncharacterized protein n=1 Tax=Laccaria amethystina LaAM-08-1 TaxID=1095629 RepID=A0A0C9WQW9_9AGAR|nr:hypothetical protein K443DRAFT_12709 [Laccaria amethystina LaAM-08-1]